MGKRSLSERDICTKFITPALEKSGWDKHLQVREEVSFTDGKIYFKGKITANQQGTEQLLKALLHQAFEVREVEEV